MNRKTGTREWSDASHNIGWGCPHRCLYCYARKVYNGSDTFHLITPTPSIPGGPPKTVMFPTRHDITPENLEHAIKAIGWIIDGGHRVLIVSKPHPECIRSICEVFKNDKDKIEFRFSISTPNEKLSALWEPGAPTPKERYASLVYAWNEGFETSVSMEPMLENADNTFYIAQNCLARYVTRTIWIGKMNKVDERVRKSTPEIAAACEVIRAQQTDAEILRLVDMVAASPIKDKVRWKDSIQEVIERLRPQQPNLI